MKIILKGTGMALTPALKAYVESKMSHLDKLGLDIQLARVELEVLKDKKTKKPFRAEANLDLGKRVLRAESAEADMYAAIDTLIPKLNSQMEKIKLKNTSKTRKLARRFKKNSLEI